MATDKCVEECKFCAIHKYGVYVLNSATVFILICLVYIYWREIVKCCRQYMPTKNADLTDLAQTEQVQKDSLPSGQLALEQPTPQIIIPPEQNAFMAPPPVIYTQPPLTSQFIAKSLPATPPPNQPQLSQYKSPVPKSPNPQAPVLKPLPPVAAPSSPTPASPQPMHVAPPPQQYQQTPPIAQPQQVETHRKATKINNLPNATKLPVKTIELPKTPEAVEALSPHESTGSSYFKQMFRGKTPVASISQYNIMKLAKNRKDKKHPHAHHKNHRK